MLSKFAAKLKELNAKHIFIIVLIFLLGFAVRAHLMKYDLIFAFDSYFHTRMVAFIIQHGFIPARDMMAYYQLGGATLGYTSFFFWFFNAAIYKIFTLGAAYNKELWIQFVKFLPAIYGALTAVAMYFFIKPIYGRKAAYMAAFMAALVPSFVYRTMSGFFEEDCLGFLWMVIGLAFFSASVKNLKFTNRAIGYAIASAVFFILMAVTWEMFLLVPLVLVSTLLFAAPMIYFNTDREKYRNFIKLYVINFAIFAIASTLYYPKWLKRTYDYVFGSLPGLIQPLVLIAALGFVAFIVYLFFSKKELSVGQKKTARILFIGMLFLILLGFLSMTILVDDLRKGGLIEMTVGEESPGKYAFGHKYNLLIAVPILALIFIPIRMFKAKDAQLHAMIFFWNLITLFMAWYKLKFTYTFGLPIAAASGFLVYEAFQLYKSNSKVDKWLLSFLTAAFAFLIMLSTGLAFAIVLAIVVAIITYVAQLEGKENLALKYAPAVIAAIILFGGVAAASIFVQNHVPSIERSFPNYKAATNWIKENTPKDAKLFNWWSYGHWLSFLGERKVLTDNRNLDGRANSDVARFYITQDLNEALAIMRRYKPDYIVLDSEGFGGMISMGVYAYNTLNTNDPRIRKYAGNRLPNGGAAFVCSLKNNYYECYAGGASLRIGKANFENLPTEWQDKPNDITLDPKMPLWLYREKDNRMLAIVNKEVNKTIFVRLWFNESNAAKYFKEVYYKDGVKIFKVLDTVYRGNRAKDFNA
ncbi:MAG: hypothetical protein J7L14_00990 [Candidatus Diapherotrites archaeon]|nr:hypothetical protein [Candidatus Diapherotrites archaeon]